MPSLVCHGFAAALILSIMTGCVITPRGDNLGEGAPQADQSNIERALPRVAILGVVNQDGIGADVLPGWIASELARASRAGGRRDVLSVAQSRRSLGPQQHAALQAEFKRSAPIAINDISGAAPNRPPADFGLILRVDRDTVAREVVAREPVGNPQDGRETLSVKTEREIGVAALLIDLNRSRELWFRHYDGVARRERTDVPFRSRANDNLRSAGSAGRDPGADAYPKTPVARVILRKILRQLADDLPAR